MTVQDLLRHTAGLSYGGYAESQSPVDKLYDEADLFNPKITNAELTNRVASLPLMFHPGGKWHYSVATDVVGYLAEVLSGKPLADFMQENIFDPLGMVDTAFHIDPSKLSLPANTCHQLHYIPAEQGWYPPPPTTCSFPNVY